MREANENPIYSNNPRIPVAICCIRPQWLMMMMIIIITTISTMMMIVAPRLSDLLLSMVVIIRVREPEKKNDYVGHNNGLAYHVIADISRRLLN